MKAPSLDLNDPRHLAGPCAAVFVALGGAALVVGGMLLVGVRELSVARFIPDFATLQSLIVGWCEPCCKENGGGCRSARRLCCS